MNWIRIGLMLTGIGAVAQTPANQTPANQTPANQTPANTAQSFNSQGNQVSEKGNYAEGVRFYREAIAIWRSLSPDFEGHLAGSLMNLGVALSGDGKRIEAAKTFEEALALHRRSLGPKHHRTVINTNLVAANLLTLGNFDGAEALFQEALLVERELYPGDIQTARTLIGLSNVLLRKGLAAQALPPGEEALAIAIKATGEASVDAALAYSNIAEVYRCAGRPERAFPLYRKARAIYERALGPEHPRAAALLSQEGKILMDEGKLSLAGESMVKAVKAIRKTCPDCLVELAIAESNLGLLRLQQKRYRDADESLSDAIALREKFETHPGPLLAESLQGLAFARKKQHLFEDAARLNTRAESIRAYR